MAISVKDFFPIQYFVHSLYINGEQVSGVQSVNVTRSYDVNNLRMLGLGTNAGMAKSTPIKVRNYYRRPDVEISFTKFLSNNVPTIFPTGFQIVKRPTDTYEIDIGILKGGGLKFRDTVFKSVSYNFTNQGNFTEQLTYAGHMIEDYPALNQPDYWHDAESTWPNGSGEVKRRKDFLMNSCIFPQEVSGILFDELETGQKGILLSVETSFSVNYGEIPSRGHFYSSRNKYVTLPVDISCTYEILDKGYKNYHNLYYGNSVSGYYVGDYVPNRRIRINSSPTIDLGSGNFLTGIDRSGGDAGSTDYSIYKYTYRNNDGSFKVTLS